PPGNMRAVPAPPVQFRQPNGIPTPAKRRLTMKDLKLDRDVFDALDQDGDGELDAEELARFGRAVRPEVEIVLRYGTLAAGGRPRHWPRSSRWPTRPPAPWSRPRSRKPAAGCSG